MRKSLRNIATASLMIGLLSFSAVTMQQIAKYCIDGQSACLTAAVSFGVSPAEIPLTTISTDQSGSTPIDASPDVYSMSEFVITLVQVTSVYLILISVIVLVVMEAFELRYLRKLVHARR